MAMNWTQKRQDVHNTLTRNGVLFTFLRSAGGKPHPITGEVSDQFDETFTSPGIRKSPSSTDAYRWNTEQASLIQAGDAILFISALNYVPRLEDRVILNGAEIWFIKGISPLAPGDITLANNLLARKG